TDSRPTRQPRANMPATAGGSSPPNSIEAGAGSGRRGRLAAANTASRNSQAATATAAPIPSRSAASPRVSPRIDSAMLWLRATRLHGGRRPCSLRPGATAGAGSGAGVQGPGPAPRARGGVGEHRGGAGGGPAARRPPVGGPLVGQRGDRLLDPGRQPTGVLARLGRHGRPEDQ